MKRQIGKHVIVMMAVLLLSIVFICPIHAEDYRKWSQGDG